MKRKLIHTERMEVRLSKKHLAMIKKIAKKIGTNSNSEIVRVCVVDYWEKI